MTEELSYEKALEQLDLRLRKLEDGNLDLDAALKAVEEARDYLRTCVAHLDAAKKRIEVRGES